MSSPTLAGGLDWALHAKTHDRHCAECPRLTRYRRELADRHPGYHCAPVAAWGRQDARLLIVGLAPGLHGANRTGKPFVGDASGATLFTSLVANDFAENLPRLRLKSTRITNVVRCVPPENRPTATEIRQCSAYLRHDLALLWSHRSRRPRCVVALGVVAFEAVGKILAVPLPPFAHGVEITAGPFLTVLASYHPSRRNVNTGRVTQPMLDAIFRRCSELLGEPTRPC